MDKHGQHLAETYLAMLNKHDPDLVDRFVAEKYRNHNAFVADGREANRQFWTAFFARWRCDPSTSGASRTLCSSSIGTN